MGLMLISLGFSLHVAFFLLLIPLILWYIHLHHGPQIALLMVLLTLYSWHVSRLERRPFQAEKQGEIVYLTGTGIQLGDTFYLTDTEGLRKGDLVSVQAEEQAFPICRNPGGYDEKHDLMGRGVYHVAKVQQLDVLGHRWQLSEWAQQLLEDRTDHRLHDLYAYILLGQKSTGVEEWISTARSLAVLHLFAISGMHFGLLKRAIEACLTHLMDEKKASLTSLILLGIYALILKGNVAAWRAYLMMVLQKRSPWNAWQCFGIVGCLFMWLNPRIIFHQAFIYSMSIYFLTLVSRRLKYAYLYVFIGAMMINTYFQYECNVCSFAVGSFLTVVISLLFPLSLLDVLLNGLLSPVCLFLYHGLLTLLQRLEAISWSLVVGRPPLLLLGIFYFLWVYAAYRQIYYHDRKMYGWTVLSIGLILFGSAFQPFGKVVMLDVGQGDCFYIQTPFHRTHILIDTGGLAYQDVAQKRIIPFLKSQGVHHLDAVYLSHQDYDHCGALESLTNHFQVDQVIWHFTEDDYGDLLLKQINAYSATDENDSSQVIYTELGGKRFLFTGDISLATEAWLLETYPDLEVDILKVAHHGSSTATGSAFLAAIQPQYAWISVGLHNRYHHPSPTVLDRLKAYGCTIWRTDEMGACSLFYSAHHVWLEKN